jgi:hypothetical protein
MSVRCAKFVVYSGDTADAAPLGSAHIWMICLVNRRINRFNRGFGRRLKRQVLELKLYRLLILILKFDGESSQ